jgi:hypothetical protein
MSSKTMLRLPLYSASSVALPVHGAPGGLSKRQGYERPGLAQLPPSRPGRGDRRVSPTGRFTCGSSCVVDGVGKESVAQPEPLDCPQSSVIRSSAALRPWLMPGGGRPVPAVRRKG